MSEIYKESRWYFSVVNDSMVLAEAGFYDALERPRVLLEISGRYIPSLVEKLDEEGYIKPRLDERLRTEDLKITHRLLDIIDKAVVKE
jgi:hypothetical protein